MVREAAEVYKERMCLQSSWESLSSDSVPAAGTKVHIDGQ